MRFKNIASGSKGNATYIGNDHTHILIDAGVSKKKIREGLEELDLSLRDISAILLTHEHSDHIRGLGILERDLQVPVYLTNGTKQVLKETGKLDISDELVHVISADQEFMVGDITVKALDISHDAREPVCYRMEENRSSCAVVTDLGRYDEKLLDELKGLSLLMLEANHDLRMLQTGPYPYPLKRRIASEKGHLSNEASGCMISRLLHEEMKHIALGHLSQKNNYSELALLAVRNEIDALSNPWHADDFPIDVADPLTGTPVYSF